MKIYIYYTSFSIKGEWIVGGGGGGGKGGDNAGDGDDNENLYYSLSWGSNSAAVINSGDDNDELSMSLNDICCYIPAWFGVIATLLTGFIAYECSLEQNCHTTLFHVVKDMLDYSNRSGSEKGTSSRGYNNRIGIGSDRGKKSSKRRRRRNDNNNNLQQHGKDSIPQDGNSHRGDGSSSSTRLEINTNSNLGSGAASRGGGGGGGGGGSNSTCTSASSIASDDLESIADNDANDASAEDMHNNYETNKNTTNQNRNQSPRNNNGNGNNRGGKNNNNSNNNNGKSKLKVSSTKLDYNPAVECGIFTMGIMAMVPAHLMRSVGGGFDNESVALSFMLLTMYFWIRSLRHNNSYGNNMKSHGNGHDNRDTDDESASYYYGIPAGIAYFCVSCCCYCYCFITSHYFHENSLIHISHLHLQHIYYKHHVSDGCVVGWTHLCAEFNSTPCRNIGTHGTIHNQVIPIVYILLYHRDDIINNQDTHHWLVTTQEF